MKICLGVKDFGKIKSAEVDISNFTVFVGNNNSGKSYMMQLIYGVLRELPRIQTALTALVDDAELVSIIDEDGFKRYETKVNQFLNDNKDRIIYRIFRRKIPIDQLYIKLTDIRERVLLEYKDVDEPIVVKNNHISEKGVYYAGVRELEVTAYITKSKDKTRDIHLRFVNAPSYKSALSIIVGYVMEDLLGLSVDHDGNALYLPASRTGMLLLYRSFFVEKDSNIKEEHFVFNDKKEYGNAYGLSEPVYEFLKFLMRFILDEEKSEKNEFLIRFIEEHLIDGSIAHIGDEDIYTPDNSKVKVPLYLASSMVNELTPVLRLLTGMNNYQTVLYDEIETCLHPSKQSEMARLLMRLNNCGYRLIVSTHSDTMATKINNLLLLSFADLSEAEKKEKLKRLNLDEEDILRSRDIHVYQFENQKDGHSIVKELEFRTMPYTGYDFSQFADNVKQRYEYQLNISI